MTGFFLDTNVIIYGIDPSDVRKRDRSLSLQRNAVIEQRAVLSMQVLAETANVMFRKLGPEYGPSEVRAEVERLATDFEVVVSTPELIDLAIEGVERFGFAFYDAQIWAAARIAGCTVLFSEDFTDGFEADGVLFRNPFAPGFDPATVLG